MLHQHLQKQQHCDVWKCHAKHFVCNHRNNMKQCIKTGTNCFSVDIFHSIEKHVRDANTAKIENNQCDKKSVEETFNVGKATIGKNAYQ